jgi:hypothetical protein
MTEYVVKLRFWLRCWDSMTIDAEMMPTRLPRLRSSLAR